MFAAWCKKPQWIFFSIMITVPLIVFLLSDRIELGKILPAFNIVSQRVASTPSKDPRKKLENLASHIPDIERPKIVQEMCNAYKFPNTSDGIRQGGKFLKNRSIYYCNIPKCGSTFLNSFLPKVLECNEKCEELVKTSERLRGKRLTQDLLDHSYSFMFVREPYARLFSGYENKLFLPNELWKPIGVQVIRSVRPEATNLSLRLGHDVTFREVVEHVLKFHEQGLTLNAHFRPMFEFCDLCRLKFNFIGKLESMSNDLAKLVHDWKVKEIVTKNRTQVTELESDTVYERAFGPYKHLFKIIKMYGGWLSRYKLFQRAWSSYHIRGLILKKYEMPFKENEVANVGVATYGAEIKKAIDASEGHTEELRVQRQEALIQAYGSVPMDLMIKLRNFMKPDCLLFGYDDMPEKLFNRSSVFASSGHNYFKGL